ncbi:hypothetical protein CKAN_00028100 [Cinnamomum micranthum f. kanehirae]|uniref:Uncharacterized protein n=1 Tax=Cinnamomum micranthum f. kanehirae TaxID=337451 RepID=A0A3S3MNR2_9MAGN|nr:hypothetical protein CKAN_00028100 [Cinnamomum micranthum f. kanehirae]
MQWCVGNYLAYWRRTVSQSLLPKAVSKSLLPNAASKPRYAMENGSNTRWKHQASRYFQNSEKTSTTNKENDPSNLNFKMRDSYKIVWSSEGRELVDIILSRLVLDFILLSTCS